MKAQYFRKGHVIRDAQDNIVFTGTIQHGDLTVPSINAAKRESRKLQAGRLGQGSLVVLH